MDLLIEKIELRMADLEKTRLCRWLSESDIDPREDRFSFTPSMLFFVLGFKDILKAMKVKNPKTPMELELNQHCEEDLDHWRWYLSDLRKMGFSQVSSWGEEVNDIFALMWSDESQPVRELVYSTIHMVKKYNDPVISLAIVEILEAAFGVFMRHMLVPIRQARAFTHLSYFGKTHFDKEAAHARGSWDESGRVGYDQTSHQILEEDVRRIAEGLVDELVGQFINVFDYWYETRRHFSRKEFDFSSGAESLPAKNYEQERPPVSPSM